MDLLYSFTLNSEPVYADKYFKSEDIFKKQQNVIRAFCSLFAFERPVFDSFFNEDESQHYHGNFILTAKLESVIPVCEIRLVSAAVAAFVYYNSYEISDEGLSPPPLPDE